MEIDSVIDCAELVFGGIPGLSEIRYGKDGGLPSVVGFFERGGRELAIGLFGCQYCSGDDIMDVYITAF